MNSLKIKQAFIYGFGKWVDYSLDFPDNNFVCIHGRNESGKSTIQKFILFMLFGLYPKERAFYRPKTSSKMGGRLTIIDQEIGEIIIERLDNVQNGKAICYTKEGEHDEEWLNTYLQGMTAKTYQSIFSFSALDLLSIHNIHEENINEILLSIGLTGSTHIHTVDKKLEQEMNDLFKPYGTKPKINQQLTLLKQLAAKRMEAEKEINQYREQKEALEQTKKEIIDLQHTLQKEKEKLLLIERKQQALPFVHPYKQAKEGLKGLRQHIPFPEDGVNRFQNLKEKIIPLQSELSIYKKNKQELKKKIDQLQSEQKKMSLINEMKLLLGQTSQYDYLLQEINDLQEIIQEQHVRLETEISYLNLSISKEDLFTLTFPFQTEKAWATIKETFEKITAERNQLLLEKQAITKNIKQLEQEKEQLKRTSLTKEERVYLEQKLQRDQETALLKQMEKEYGKQQQKLQYQKKHLKRKSRFAISLSLCFALISGIIALISHSFIFITGAIVGAVIAIFFWVSGKNSVSNLEEIFTWSENPSEPPLTKEKRQEIGYRLTQDDENQLRLTNLQERLNTLNIKYQLLQEQYTNWKIKEQQLDKQIGKEQETYPFLMEVKVEDWPTLYHSIKRLIGEASEIEKTEEKRKKKEKEKQYFEKNVRELGFKMNQAENETVSNAITFFEKIVEQYEKNQTDLENHHHTMKEMEKQIHHLQEHILHYEEEQRKLFNLADVQDEDEFYKCAKEKENKQEFESTIQQIHTQFVTIFSKTEWELFLLENKTEQGLLICQQEQKETILVIEQKLNEKRQAVATYQAQLEKIESSESYSKLIHRLQMEKEQLSVLSKRWSILKTAQAMLRETKQLYKEKYLQDVLEQATNYFSYITDHKYQRIIAPTDKQPFLVETSQRIKFSVHELSQGTIDQLYVSLRLAIGEVMGEKHQLPFIIDDAFVHFDSTRLNRILPILTSISKKKQIIFFTCKQEILENIASENKVDLLNVVRVTP